MAVGAILESKEGRVAVRAKAVVDTTGDGDMFVRAGEGYEGDIDTDNIHHCANTASLLSGVDVHKWFAWQDQNPDLYKDFMKRGREATSISSCPRRLAERRGVLHGPRFSGFDVLKIDDLTHLEILSRESLVELLNFYRQHVPGFENAWIMLTARSWAPAQPSPQRLGPHDRRRHQDRVHWPMRSVLARASA